MFGTVRTLQTGADDHGHKKLTKEHRFTGTSRCAREDSNPLGPFSPQGPQPFSEGVDTSSSVQIFQIRQVSWTQWKHWTIWTLPKYCHGCEQLPAEIWLRLSRPVEKWATFAG
jgi:hypothetical protein